MNKFEMTLWINNDDRFSEDEFNLKITKIVQGEIEEKTFGLIREAIIARFDLEILPREKEIKLIATERTKSNYIRWIFYTIEIIKEIP